MDEQLRLLQAEIRADLETIREVYERLEDLNAQASHLERDIALGYYLHVLYGLFENLFRRVAEKFGNHITDEAQWHANLLRRMTLDVLPIRPKVISKEAYACLNELRSFRHLFRNAYLLEFDSTRLDIVLQQALALKLLYETEINTFLEFLEQLADKDS